MITPNVSGELARCIISKRIIKRLENNLRFSGGKQNFAIDRAFAQLLASLFKTHIQLRAFIYRC